MDFRAKALEHKHKLFARFYAGGMPAYKAYLEAGFNCTENTARTESSKLLARPGIHDMVEELRADAMQQAELLLATKAMTKAELNLYLSDGIRVAVDDVDGSSKFSQEKTVRSVNTGNSDGPEIIETKVKIVPKASLITAIMALNGWNKPQEVKISIESQIGEIVDLVRAPTQ
jgi:hypothetical protein